jgi:hypothetical protein
VLVATTEDVRPAGTAPHRRLLLDNTKCCIAVRTVQAVGIVPVSWLDERVSWVRAVSVLHSWGSVLVNALEPSSRSCSWVCSGRQ